MQAPHTYLTCLSNCIRPPHGETRCRSCVKPNVAGRRRLHGTSCTAGPVRIRTLNSTRPSASHCLIIQIGGGAGPSVHAGRCGSSSAVPRVYGRLPFCANSAAFCPIDVQQACPKAYHRADTSLCPHRRRRSTTTHHVAQALVRRPAAGMPAWHRSVNRPQLGVGVLQAAPPRASGGFTAAPIPLNAGAADSRRFLLEAPAATPSTEVSSLQLVSRHPRGLHRVQPLARTKPPLHRRCWGHHLLSLWPLLTC